MAKGVPLKVDNEFLFPNLAFEINTPKENTLFEIWFSYQEINSQF